MGEQSDKLKRQFYEYVVRDGDDMAMASYGHCVEWMLLEAGYIPMMTTLDFNTSWAVGVVDFATDKVIICPRVNRFTFENISDTLEIFNRRRYGS